MSGGAERVVTVFGSGRLRDGDPHYAEARQLGAQLAARGFRICSGGYGGVMEAASRGAKEAGGRTLGVTAEFFRSTANEWIDEQVRVKTWQERLFELIKRGDAYVTCPGGTGTLAELAVVWEMLNKGAMARKPFVVLGEFWRPVVDLVSEVEFGRARDRGKGDAPLVHVAASPADAGAYLADRF
ncbi:MAG TPA: LOG family protein [Candidatus Baltobacteraceae bacterium]|nr:LOG family protein [Candidatus Baltobacteraceae bacterium]